MTPRTLVKNTLEFCNKTDRVPRQLWYLPWAETNYPRQLQEIRQQFPDDITSCPAVYRQAPKTIGDPYAVGSYTDEWGCVFQNLHAGVIGEVKHAIISPDDEDWEDLSRVHIPTEWLSFDKDAVNDFCRRTDRFVLSGCCPRPFERLQFLRGTEQLYIDLMLRPAGLTAFLSRLHAFYCELLEQWAETEVDALSIMDDWGAQNSLLIHPALWVEVFQPLYKDYVDIAHRKGKKIFMHSDGNILSIYPHLIELGLDAINSQLFCMGLESLAPFRGKITFWGEMDRQHLLPSGAPGDIQNAVAEIYATLWKSGGCIAQCEFGPGAQPDNVHEVFESWAGVR